MVYDQNGLQMVPKVLELQVPGSIQAQQALFQGMWFLQAVL